MAARCSRRWWPTAGRWPARFTWTTMPEALSRTRHVSWKVYTAPAGGSLDNVLTYFKNFGPARSSLRSAFDPTYPDDFLADVQHDRLPHVSWLLTGALESEHPGVSSSCPASSGVRQIVAGAASPTRRSGRRPRCSSPGTRTAASSITLPPPTPPKGTKGEFVSVAKLPDAAQGIRGPIGLGFRVPMLVVSPFSRGGLVCSDIVRPHLDAALPRDALRREGAEPEPSGGGSVTGDLTGAFNFAGGLKAARPRLTKPKAVNVACVSPQPPVVTSGPIPKQERGRRKRPSGIVRK